MNDRALARREQRQAGCAFGVLVLDEAPEHQRFAGAHGDLGVDLPLQEGILLGDGVFRAESGDGLVDFERDQIARVHRWRDVEHHASVLVLDVVGGGDGAAAADGGAGVDV